MSIFEKSLELIGSSSNFRSSKFTGKLLRYFNIDEIRKLCIGLKKSGAIIAGGSVLGAFVDFKIKDLDIYVNEKNLMIIHDLLESLGYKSYGESCIAPAYDQSFFRKNHIMARFVFKKIPGNKTLPIDIMVIPNDIQVENVAQNFDLSFCEIWFDGENVYAVDPVSITNKSGVLKPDYVNSLFVHFNKFIQRRIIKYSRRGFKIEYSRIPTYAVGYIKEIKTTSNPEEWVVYKLYNQFVRYCIKSDIKLFKDFIITEFTVKNLFKMLKRYYRIVNPSKYTFNRDGDLEPVEEANSVRERINGRLGDLIPEIAKRRINKKIKLLIKYYLFFDHDLSIALNSTGYIGWKDYFNEFLNKDVEDIEQGINESGEIDYKIRKIAGENFYVDFTDQEEIDENSASLLTNVIFVDLSGNIPYGRLLDTVSFFKKANVIDNLKISKADYSILKDFKILDDSYDEIKIDEYLTKDSVNNFVFLNAPGDRGGIKGYGLKIDDLCQLYSSISLQCKGINHGFVVPLDMVFDKWYYKGRFGPSLSNGILLSKLNAVLKELEKEDGNRIFYLTDERKISPVAGLLTVVYSPGSLNILGSDINVVSRNHCGDGTELDVYDNIFIVDHQTPGRILGESKDEEVKQESKDEEVKEETKEGHEDKKSSDRKLFSTLNDELYNNIFNKNYVEESISEYGSDRMIDELPSIENDDTDSVESPLSVDPELLHYSRENGNFLDDIDNLGSDIVNIRQNLYNYLNEIRLALQYFYIRGVDFNGSRIDSLLRNIDNRITISGDTHLKIKAIYEFSVINRNYMPYYYRQDATRVSAKVRSIDNLFWENREGSRDRTYYQLLTQLTHEVFIEDESSDEEISDIERNDEEPSDLSSLNGIVVFNTRQELYRNINNIKSALRNRYIRDENLFTNSNTYTVILSVIYDDEIPDNIYDRFKAIYRFAVIRNEYVAFYSGNDPHTIAQTVRRIDDQFWRTPFDPEESYLERIERITRENTTGGIAERREDSGVNKKRSKSRRKSVRSKRRSRSRRRNVSPKCMIRSRRRNIKSRKYNDKSKSRRRVSK